MSGNGANLGADALLNTTSIRPVDRGRLLHPRLRGLGVAQVYRCHSGHREAGSLDHANGLVVARFVEVAPDDKGSFLRKLQRSGSPHAAGRARNQRNLAV